MQVDPRASLLADPDYAEVTLSMGFDFDGKKCPITAHKQMPDGRLLQVKAVQQPDGQTFKDFYYDREAQDWVELVEDEPGPWIVRGVGSSEVGDMDGDIMHKSALESMCKTSAGLNTWIAHKVEDDFLFGSLIEQPSLTYREAGGPNRLINATKSYAAVEIASDVETENARAVRQYRYIKKGRQWGWSVGCFYTDAQPRTVNGRVKGADVFEVAVAEWSIVPLPNNQQSWVDATHKALVRKGILLPDDLANAENLYRLLHEADFPLPVRGKLIALQEYMNRAGIYLCGKAS